MKKKFNEKLQIPYFKTERGTVNYMGTFDYSYNYEIDNWYYPSDSVKNFIFEDRLILDCYAKGSSSVKFLFKSETTGNGYEMFLQDAFSLIKEGMRTLKTKSGGNMWRAHFFGACSEWKGSPFFPCSNQTEQRLLKPNFPGYQKLVSFYYYCFFFFVYVTEPFIIAYS